MFSERRLVAEGPELPSGPRFWRLWSPPFENREGWATRPVEKPAAAFPTNALERMQAAAEFFKRYLERGSLGPRGMKS